MVQWIGVTSSDSIDAESSVAFFLYYLVRDEWKKNLATHESRSLWHRLCSFQTDVILNDVIGSDSEKKNRISVEFSPHGHFRLFSTDWILIFFLISFPDSDSSQEKSFSIDCWIMNKWMHRCRLRAHQMCGATNMQTERLCAQPRVLFCMENVDWLALAF